nr:hypothetical protein [Tanacetum cinerariifolium]
SSFLKLVDERNIDSEILNKSIPYVTSIEKIHHLVKSFTSLWIPIRHETEVPQTSSPLHTNVVDEATSTGVYVRHGGSSTTITRLDVGNGSGNIGQTLTMPHDSPLSRVYTLGSDKGTSSFNIEEWEDIQARVEANEELAVRLQAKERENYTEAEKARMLAEFIN